MTSSKTMSNRIARWRYKLYTGVYRYTGAILTFAYSCRLLSRPSLLVSRLPLGIRFTICSPKQHPTHLQHNNIINMHHSQRLKRGWLKPCTKLWTLAQLNSTVFSSHKHTELGRTAVMLCIININKCQCSCERDFSNLNEKWKETNPL